MPIAVRSTPRTSLEPVDALGEASKRERLAAGELGLDICGMRERLAAKGLTYVDHEGE